MAKAIQLTTAELKHHPSLCAIDGVLYDLVGFAPNHPGGEHIEGAGAYDASALYASMHPGRQANNSALLQKYRVGTHVRGDGDIIYRYDSVFAKDLLRTVRSTLRNTSWWAPVGFYLRILVIAAATLYSEWNFIVTGTFFWACLIGVCHAQIGLSIQHDASHGAISKSSAINDFFAYGADWIGNSKWIWFQQHILWHHPHTNHPEYDPDTTSAEPFVKFQPYGEYKWFHKFQYLFLHLVLSLYGPSIVLNGIVISIMQHNEHVPESVGKTKYMTRQKIIAWGFRIFYLFRICFLPWYIGSAHVVVSLVPSYVTGILLTFVFVVSHNFEGSDRDPTGSKLEDANVPAVSEQKASKNEEVETVAASRKLGEEEEEEKSVAMNDKEIKQVCWYKAQAETSCTYGGTIGMLLTGGLNLQIEHHLFPRISSWYYPVIQNDVRACCERHGVQYVYFPTLGHNIIDMLQYIRKVGMTAAMKEHAH
jgi:fatty acid desaturase (delta-4 desaturase)